MEGTQELAVRTNHQIIQTVDDAARVAKAMAMSGFFSDVKDVSQAMVKIMAGQEIGIGAFASMTGIHIIKGKPTLGGNVIATLIKNDPRYDYRVLKLDDKGCEIEFCEGGRAVGISSFSENDAKAANLLGNDNYKKFSRNMYFNRAISNGAKWFVPGVFGGAPVYTPDELGAIENEDGSFYEYTPQTQVQEIASEAEVVADFSVEPLRYRPEELKARLEEVAAAKQGQKITPEKRGLVVVCMEQALSNTTDPKASRKNALKYLTGKTSTTEISDETMLALHAWLEPNKDDGGQWECSPMAEREVRQVLTAAMPEQDGLFGAAA